MLVVTGANRPLDRGVVEKVLCRAPAGWLVASRRDPQQTATLTEQSMQVRTDDVATLAEWTTSFAGAEQVLVVSVNQLGEPGH